jgi:hypothetical protein
MTSKEPSMAGTEHATIHGSPGEGARMAGIGRALWPLLAAVFITGYVVGATLGTTLAGWAAGVVLVLAGTLLLLGTFLCRRRVHAFFKGAAGEEIVARELARLPAGFDVFHALDTGGGVLMWHRGDIDHVVVGPTGVFAIETKNWRGPVTLAEGQLLAGGMAPRREALEQARCAVSQLQVRLGRAGIYHAEVVPVLCFASDAFEGGSTIVGDVVICNASVLLTVLQEAGRSGRPQVDSAAIVRVLSESRRTV